MRKLFLPLFFVFAFSGCKKGLIFDKEMVIGDWRMWELYSPGNTYYWTFTEDSVFIFLQPDSLDGNSKSPSGTLVYKQGNWNTVSFNINLFQLSNPFDSAKMLTSYIDISKNHRDYLVIKADHYNWTATLSRLK